MKLLKMALITSLFVFSGYTTLAVAAEKNHDGEIIAYMEALNNAEINVSKEAKDKKVDDSVMKFADMMIDQHGQNLQQVTDLSSSANIPADDTAAVKKFKDEHDQALAKLSKMDDAKFQKAYIEAMINGHTNAEKMIGKFEKEAQNPDLKKYLAETKTVVGHHLADAKKLK